MSKRKWRVMLTLEDDANSNKTQLEWFISQQLEETDKIKITRIEAVEVSQ